MIQVRRRAFLSFLAFSLATLRLACSSDGGDATNTGGALDTTAQAQDSDASQATAADLPDVIVTYSVLASIVRELVEGVADVVTIIPDGRNPHDFEPSAKDIEAINNAAFVVANGLGFDEGLDASLEKLRDEKGPVFFVGERVTVREMAKENSDHNGDGNDHSDDHHRDDHHGDGDPHVWMSPATMIEMLPELADELGAVLGTDLSASLAAVTADLTALDAEVAAIMSGVKKCELVTGHHEMGYFAERYGCELIGAIIPSTTTTAEASAGELAKLKEVILEHGTKVVFVTLGTPQAVAAQIAKETGASLVELPTDSMGTATSYAEFMKSIANRIADALK